MSKGFDFKKFLAESLEEKHQSRDAKQEWNIRMETPARKGLVKLVENLAEKVEVEVCETCGKEPCECMEEALEEESLSEDGEDYGATGAASVETPEAKRKRQLAKLKGKFSKKTPSKHPDMGEGKVEEGITESLSVGAKVQVKEGGHPTTSGQKGEVVGVSSQKTRSGSEVPIYYVKLESGKTYSFFEHRLEHVGSEGSAEESSGHSKKKV